MASYACVLPSWASRIAVTVMKSEPDPMLCPFFGKCDGLWIVDTDTGATEFRANLERTPDALCDLIVSAGSGRLICSFIGEAEKRRLSATGIDVRLGSCASAIQELVASFHQLAAA